MYMNIKNLKYILILLLCAFSLQARSENAAEVLSKAATKINSAKGLSCAFTLTSGTNSTKGTLKSSGSKYVIKTGVSSVWYNGKTMATYNPRTKEMTLMTPTSAELAESNPLCYLRGYEKEYTASFAKTAIKGKKVIELTAKRRTAAAKKVIITLSGTSGLPEKFTITGNDGSMTTAVISGLKYAASIPASEFNYPKMKGVEIVDLR